MGGGNAVQDSSNNQDNFQLVSQQLERLKEDLVNKQNNSRQQQHSRQSSELGGLSNSFNF